MAKKPTAKKTVATLKHDAAKRRNIPTAEFQSVLKADEQEPIELRYPRNTDLDPQLVWRGKDQQDWSDLAVHAPPLYIQEKVHPKVLIDGALRCSQEASNREGRRHTSADRPLLRLPQRARVGAKKGFYQRDVNCRRWNPIERA